jgi:hypothetical protein
MDHRGRSVKNFIENRKSKISFKRNGYANQLQMLRDETG